jgi:HD-GYP domain-containing protein (c-di-GMP phosphodiesterase class II)
MLGMAADAAKAIIGVGAVSILVKESESDTPVPYITNGSTPDKETAAFLEGDHAVCKKCLKSQKVELTSTTLEKKRKRIRTLAAYPLKSRGKTLGLLNVIQEDDYTTLRAGQIHLLSVIASKVASLLENMRLYEHLQTSYLTAIKALANAIEARDNYTRGHTNRVTELADLIAQRLDWSSEKRAELKTGCTLHDIGKIGVPDAILNKPEILTEEERQQMEVHPLLGARILEGIDFLAPAIPYILYHHERYDGTGYPHGLAGEEIPVEGRLLAVVDTYDAIVSDRPYRSGATPEVAIEELKRFKNIQFDPVIVDVFIEAWRDGAIEELEVYRMVSAPTTA